MPRRADWHASGAVVPHRLDQTHTVQHLIVSQQVDQSKVVDLEIMQGQCHLHHSKMVHGSNANTSARRRCGYTMRYMSTSVKVKNMSERSTHAIYLARGKDLGGNEYSDPPTQFVAGLR